MRGDLVHVPAPWRARGRDRSTWALVALAVGIALAVRLVVIFAAHPTCEPRANEESCWSQGGDALYYATQADALADGHAFVASAELARGVPADEAGPGAAHPPLFTVALAVGALLGADTPTEFRVWSSLLSAATVVVLAVLAWRLTGRRGAVVAAGLVAIVPDLWLNDVVAMSESLYALVVAGVLLAALSWWSQPSRRKAIALGALIGLATLTRAESALLVPFLVVPLVLARGRGPSSPLPAMATMAAASLAIVLPWIGWNMLRFEEPTLLTTSTGITILSGSCDATYEGRAIGNYHATCSAPLYAEQAQLRRDGTDPGDESEIDAVAREMGLEYVGDHVGRAPLVAAFRVGRALGVIELDRSLLTDTVTEERWEPGVRLGQWTYLAMVPASVIGLLLLRRREITIVPFLATLAAVVVLAMFTSGLTRFRTPLEVSCVVLTTVTVVAVWDLVRARRSAARRDRADAEDVAPTTPSEA